MTQGTNICFRRVLFFHECQVVNKQGALVVYQFDFSSSSPPPPPLQHRAKGSDDPYKEIDGIATTRYSVGGLSPYSHYDFRVAAVNTIGQGPSSDAVEARTAEQAPSSPPRQVGMNV